MLEGKRERKGGGDVHFYCQENCKRETKRLRETDRESQREREKADKEKETLVWV